MLTLVVTKGFGARRCGFWITSLGCEEGIQTCLLALAVQHFRLFAFLQISTFGTNTASVLGQGRSSMRGFMRQDDYLSVVRFVISVWASLRLHFSPRWLKLM